MEKQKLGLPTDRVTIRHVAEHAGVSVAAVSKVLRNAYGVSEALRTKVENAIDLLKYRPSTAARAMRGRTYTVGILVVELTNPFVPVLLEGIDAGLAEANYKAMVGVGRAASKLETSMIESMIDTRMDGLVLIGPQISGSVVAHYAKQIPIVAIAHHEPQATLYDTALSLLLPHASNWFASKDSPRLLGSAHPNIAPYDKFKAHDGELFIGILNDAQFRRLGACLGLETWLDDERFSSNSLRVVNRAALKALIEAAIADRPCEPLCEALMRSGVPAGAVNSVPQALAHAHCEHRDIVVRRSNYTGLRSPMRLLGTPGSPGVRPPGFAQDAEAILVDLGYSENDRQRLRDTGAAPGPRT